MPKKLTIEEFINKAIKIHNNKYVYSKVEYINNQTKVCIICPEHGEFWQTPHMHLRGQGCPRCAKNHKYTNEDFLKKIQEIHNNKYIYDDFEPKNIMDKIKVICPEHGEFTQTLRHHLNGNGCPKCSSKAKITKDDIINRGNEIHNGKYDYSKISENIINNRMRIIIICPEHGEFEMSIDNHLNQKQGCPICKESKIEKDIANILKANNIFYKREHSFEWLRINKYHKQKLDFYLPDYNIAIECQGLQHFKLVEHFGGEKCYERRIIMDKRKYMLCKEHNIKLIYYTNVILKSYPYDIFIDKNKLIEYIKNVKIKE